MTSNRVERRISAARKARRDVSAPYAANALPAGAKPEAVGPEDGPFEDRVIDFLTLMYTELKEDEKDKFCLFLQLLQAADEHPVKTVAERAPGIIKGQTAAIFKEYPEVVKAYKALVRGSKLVPTLAVKAMVQVAVEYKFVEYKFADAASA